MFKKILFALLATTAIIARTTEHSIVIEKEELIKGISVYHMVDHECATIIGSLTVSEGHFIKELAEIAQIYGEDMPEDVLASLTDITTVYKAIASARQTIYFIGDLYIHPDFRQNGFAQLLLNHVCTELSDENPKCIIALIPDPFEMDEKNTQQSLKNEAAYHDKKAQLIKLYEKCGFSKYTSNNVLYMTYN